jgi:multidrug efflux pump subunit AcrA (membrane-fusion protein)
VNQTSKASQTLIWGILVPLILIGLGFGAFAAMGKQKPKQAASEGTDTVSKLRKLPIVSVGKVEGTQTLKTLDLSISGTVVPFRQINLAVEIAGRVRMKSENCQIGRFVKRGDILFELDPTDFELEVERLEAMRQSEIAQQSELDQEIAGAKKSLLLAEEELAIQEKELERLTSLAKGFVSQTELDQARRQRVASANQRLNIQNQLQMFDTRWARLKSAERLAMAQLEQAKVNLQRSKIASPIDGVIVTESVQTDSFVQRGATLCVIEDIQRVEVSCNLRTDQLLLVLQQQSSVENKFASGYELPNTPVTVSYRVSGREEASYQWQGQLSRYEGLGLDPQSRTTPIRIRVDNPQEIFQNGARIYEKSSGGLPALVRGMFVECDIHTKPPANTVLLPKLGLKPGNQVWKFVTDNSIVVDQESTSLAPETPPQPATETKKPTKNMQVNINPAEWTSGRLQIIPNVRVINLIPFGPQQDEYWVVEGKDLLLAGDQVVVSPLANVVGDGNDQVRYQSQVTEIAAEGSKE